METVAGYTAGIRGFILGIGMRLFIDRIVRI
jgi:hypothetical protein